MPVPDVNQLAPRETAASERGDGLVRARAELARADDVELEGLRAFLEELRRSFSHDLRTPLGTIVNYAALLEGAGGVPLSDQHAFARHIRRNAMRAANMLEHLSTAAVLAARPAQLAQVDLEALLERALLSAGAQGRAKARIAVASPAPPLDAELVQFAWSAYLTLEADVRGAPPDAVSLAIDGAELVVTVGDEAAPRDGTELARYLAEAGENARPETRHSLRLAIDVLALHGGDVALAGRAGAGSSLRLSFR